MTQRAGRVEPIRQHHLPFAQGRFGRFTWRIDVFNGRGFAITVPSETVASAVSPRSTPATGRYPHFLSRSLPSHGNWMCRSLIRIVPVSRKLPSPGFFVFGLRKPTSPSNSPCF
jgi:hypothetical protein